MLIKSKKGIAAGQGQPKNRITIAVFLTVISAQKEAKLRVVPWNRIIMKSSDYDYWS